MLLLAAIVTLWPALFSGWVHLTFLVASLHLGRWPLTSGQDDPQTLPGVSLMHDVGILAFLFIPFALLLALVIAARLGLSEPRLGLAAGLLLLAGIAIPILLGDPINAWVWFWD